MVACARACFDQLWVWQGLALCLAYADMQRDSYGGELRGCVIGWLSWWGAGEPVATLSKAKSYAPAAAASDGGGGFDGAVAAAYQHTDKCPGCFICSGIACCTGHWLAAALGIAIGCLLTEPLFAAADFGSPAESLDLDAKVAWTELSPEVKEVGKRIRCTALLLCGGC